MQIVEVVPHHTGRSAAPPGRPGACCPLKIHAGRCQKVAWLFGHTDGFNAWAAIVPRLLKRPPGLPKDPTLFGGAMTASRSLRL
jgi:hypothetical protein